MKENEEIKLHLQNGQKGVALIMVLVVVGIFTFVTLEFIRQVQVRAMGTLNIRDEIRAEYLARSTVNLTRLLLAVQGVISREMKKFHMRPPPLWQFADYFVLSFNDPTALEMVGSVIGASMEGAEGFGSLNGSIQVAVVDEESKININMASMGTEYQSLLSKYLTVLISPPVYDELFNKPRRNGQIIERQEVITALIDWVDRDEIVYGTSSSPESNLYEMDEESLPVKNAPIDDIEELHMIRGIDDDFWAAFIEPEPDHPEARTLTVWGSGKININTADPMVLFAVLCTFARDPAKSCSVENLDTIFNLIQYMMDVRSLLGVPFANTGRFIQNIGKGIENIPGIALNRRDVNKYLTVDSWVFSIYATGKVGRSKKRIWAVVDTRGAAALNGGTLLYWKIN